MTAARRPALFAAAAIGLITACSSSTPPAPPLTPTSGPASSVTAVPATTESLASSSPAEATSSSAAPGTDVPATDPPTSPPEVATSVAPAGPDLDAADVAVEEVTTLEAPIATALVPGDAGSLYVAQQNGLIVRLDLASGETSTVADLEELTNGGGEQGLLGLATAPDGSHLYVNYTDDDGTSQVDELPIAGDGSLDVDTRRNVLSLEQPHANHNGGHLAFGPDGYLYIGFGDGGAANDPDRRSLDTGDLLGKMLRIDPAPVSGFPYSVPPDNPFVGVDGARIEIWSTGLRNPWRFSFDRLTGDLWIGDVGQGEWEEIDVAFAADGGGRALSFGWSAFEGTHRFNDDQPSDGHVPPVWEYEHSDDDGCSVTGGYVYRGTAVPALYGAYVFGDYCSGKIWAAEPPTNGEPITRVVEIATVKDLASFGEDAAGELYTLSLAGAVGRLR